MNKNEIAAYLNDNFKCLYQDSNFKELYDKWTQAFQDKSNLKNSLWIETGNVTPEGEKIYTVKDNPVFVEKFDKAEEDLNKYIVSFRKKNPLVSKIKEYHKVWRSTVSLKNDFRKVYSWKEANDLLPVFEEAERIWVEAMDKYKDDGGDMNGSCVIGAGFTIYIQWPRKRTGHETYVIVPRKYQGAHVYESTMDVVKEFLKSKGVEYMYNWGRLD